MKMGNIKLENIEPRIMNSGYFSNFRKKLKDYLFSMLFIIVLGNLATSADIKKYSPKLETLAQDSTTITVRRPSEGKMSALRKSNDYRYTVQDSQIIDTWWKRLLRRFYNWFNSIFTGVGNPTLWKTVAYVFIVSVIVYVTLKLMGVNFSGLYRKKNNNEIPYETLGENIHTIDFADSIAEATVQRNYRLAVRLYYLKTLKELADRKMIDWRINKTNRSYVYELNSPTLRPDFERITLQFEYAWYGDFSVDETQFLNIKNQFLTFSDSILANG